VIFAVGHFLFAQSVEARFAPKPIRDRSPQVVDQKGRSET
jgi:hypothetical protein